MTHVRLSKTLLEQGYSYAELTRLTRKTELVRIRRGAYAAGETGELDPRLTHLQLLEATVGQCAPESVVSHASAAAIHGLPIGQDQLARVHLTRDRQGQGRVRRYVQVHGQPLPESDVVEVGGFRVTSLGRTVLDLACALRPLLAVPVGDVALQQGLSTEELTERLAAAGQRRGIPNARRTVALLDPRTESPGESMSRVVFAEHRIPAPAPQFRVFDKRRRFVGRADFGWDEERTLGEFDGRKKYGRLLLKPGQTPEDALFEEKLREDRLRDLGWQIVRWIWADLYAPDDLILRLQRAFVRGRRSRCRCLRPFLPVATSLSVATGWKGRKGVRRRHRCSGGGRTARRAGTRPRSRRRRRGPAGRCRRRAGRSGPGRARSPRRRRAPRR